MKAHLILRQSCPVGTIATVPTKVFLHLEKMRSQVTFLKYWQ